MKRTIRGILVLVVLMVTLLFCVTITTASTQTQKVQIGTYLDVPAYSNGAQTGTGYGYWQCVEYVKRLYSQKLGISGFSGNAYTYYNKASALGLRSYPNGSPFSPWPKDILVYSGGTGGYGHVAVITAVRSDSIDVIEQNVNRYTAYRTIPKSGNTFSKWGSYSVTGWVRVPLMRVTGTDKVYYIDANYKKAWIPTANVFNSWGWSWSGINDVSKEEFDKYPTADLDRIVFKDGTFIKYDNDIAIIQGGQKCQFTNWQAYINHGGSPTLKGVYTVDASEWSLNARGPDINN